MEALQVLDFEVKSIIHNYVVKFVDESSNIIKSEIRDGDVVLMDKNIKELYPKIASSIPKNNLLIDIEAHENQKSYEGLIPIINKLIGEGFRKDYKLICIGGTKK